MALAAYFLQRVLDACAEEGLAVGNDITSTSQQTAPIAGQRKRRKYTKRVYRTRINIFSMPEDQILRLYRFDVQTIMYILSLIKPELENRRNITSSIPPLVKLLAVLQFCATGSFQGVCALSNGISQSAFCVTLKTVMHALLKYTTRFITFPRTVDALQEAKRSFYSIAGFPCVIGCVGGIHIRIVPPAADEEIYRNRKRHHSLNVQMVCCSSLKIIHCFPNIPDSASDSFVLRSRCISKVMQDLPQESGWLLGDSTYSLQPWLLTPFLNPQTTAEEQYNAAHLKTCNMIERTFGLLKSRFHCLNNTGGDLLYSPQKTCDIITMCAILHNISRDRNVPLPDDMAGDDDELEEVEVAHVDHEEGREVRQQLVLDFFS